MKKLIRLSKSSLSNIEKKLVIEVLDEEFLGMGKYVDIFENKLRKYFNREVVCTSSGTSALQMALQAYGITKNHEVIVTSLTYIATIQAISATGAMPIFCDIDEDSLTINPEEIEKLITKKTRAIVPVHYSGGVGKLDKIYNIAKKHKLIVIEDAAHSFGGYYKNKKIGTTGETACFSFDGIKNITSGEGGCVVSSNKKVIEKIKDIRLLGVKGDSENRFNQKRSWEFDVDEQGWRYHMSNIMAAIGIGQLSRLNEFAINRRKIANLYDIEMKRIGCEFIKHNYNKILPHIYVIKLPIEIDRDYVRKKMEENNIQTGIHYYPNHYLTKYKNSKIKKLNVTEKVYKQILTLPLHNDLNNNEIMRITKTLEKIINESRSNNNNN